MFHQTNGFKQGRSINLPKTHLRAAQVKANPNLVPLVPFIENMFPGAKNYQIPGSASANYFYDTWGTYAGSELDGWTSGVSFAPLATGAKKPGASMALFRKNSVALPCNWFVPLLVVSITTPLAGFTRFIHPI